MAIFVASTKSISRGKGQSAVASASYRAGVKIKDERHNKTHNYTKRGGVMGADIILPTSVADAVQVVDRANLWNMAEQSEKRKDARVAREWLVNLPHELDEQTRKNLAHDFAQTLANRYGVVADCAIHQPTEKEIERGADARNFHAHILLTTRKAVLTDDGKLTLGDKSDAELSDAKRKQNGLPKMSAEVTEVREIWERLVNDKLLEHNHQLVDSRSYRRQGIDLMPQIKMGEKATQLERDGISTIKGDINRIITERNELVFNLELVNNKRINDKADQIIIERRQYNDELRAEHDRADKDIDWANTVIEDNTARIRSTQQRVEDTEHNTAWVNQSVREATQKLASDHKNIDAVEQRLVRAEQAIGNTQRCTESTERNTAVVDKKAREANEVTVWAIKRVGGINKRIDASKQRLARAEQAIDRATAIDNQTVARPTIRPPTPFDANARRARFARQQERIDREVRDRKHRASRIDYDLKQRQQDIERAIDSFDRLKLVLSRKFASRNSSHFSYSFGKPTPQQLRLDPNKFDARQLQQLDRFADKVVMPRLAGKTIQDRGCIQKAFADLMDEPRFITNNSDILYLIAQPGRERKYHEKHAQTFYDFKVRIDADRTTRDEALKREWYYPKQLVGEIRNIITAPDYLKALDRFIDDENNTTLSVRLARELRTDTVKETADNIALVSRNFNKYISSNQYASYLELLDSHLSHLKDHYGVDLPDDTLNVVQEAREHLNRTDEAKPTYRPGLRR